MMRVFLLCPFLLLVFRGDAVGATAGTVGGGGAGGGGHWRYMRE